MKTLEQVREFYESELKQSLAAMEQDRQKMISKAMTVAGIIGGVGLVGGLLMVQQGAPPVVLLIVWQAVWGHFPLPIRITKQGINH
jgi:hypothetical protein